MSFTIDISSKLLRIGKAKFKICYENFTLPEIAKLVVVLFKDFFEVNILSEVLLLL